MKNQMNEWRDSTIEMLRAQQNMRDVCKKFINNGEKIENIVKELKGIDNEVRLYK
eukprot:CAMPEP_0116921940 /NCGR_PEP_ID=MMETSP0467-20121206/21947_1 /TAXON_ID=283647 /ORGANISM="Mesodinium pulex, Strain SPMC105" /LENGTH=54 /DNA_ID=CAMNT_0004600139 /DNA_START=1156 /DNA_END=1320 /DNA_ORIENTATION=+